jgi:hypothetical protein
MNVSKISESEHNKKNKNFEENSISPVNMNTGNNTESKKNLN